MVKMEEGFERTLLFRRGKKISIKWKRFFGRTLISREG